MSKPERISGLPLPPGYTALAPFNRDDFRDMGRRGERPHAFARELNAVPVSAAEFFHAARHYPIVFVRDSATGAFVPVAVTGLDERRNLFVDDNGRWLDGRYVPAWVRRWPFLAVAIDGEPEKSLVCVDPAGLEKNDAPLIDANGEPTLAWQETERLLNDMEAAHRQTVAMARRLAELDLLEPFEAHALSKGGDSLRLANLHRVNETRLNALADRPLRQLMTKGFLSRIYAHLVSLENFQQLLDLRRRHEQQRGDA